MQRQQAQHKVITLPMILLQAQWQLLLIINQIILNKD